MKQSRTTKITLSTWKGLSLELAVIIYKVHLISCVFMTGLIWLIQLVHYPSFDFIDRSIFHHFSVFHQRRITWIVAPLMLMEAMTAASLVWIAPSQLFYWVNFIGVVGIWLTTIALSMPQHHQLSKGFSATALRKLVRTNWIRTALWSSRSIMLILYCGVQL